MIQGMAVERNIPNPELPVGPEQLFKPFAGREPLTPDERFLEQEFFLVGVGKGTVVFERAGDPDIERYIT